MSRITQQPTKDCSGRVDAQLAELIETVWACERTAQLETRIDALVAAADRYDRPGRRR
jgi:hypothetical protein